MKHRRAWISLFTVCALLAQTVELAWALPMSQMSLGAAPVQTQESQEQATPCHSGAAAGVNEKLEISPALGAAQDQAPAKCCGDETCDHTALCGAGPALTSSVVLPAWIPAAESVVTAVAAAVISPYSLTPLRPPITSQS